MDHGSGGQLVLLVRGPFFVREWLQEAAAGNIYFESRPGEVSNSGDSRR